MDIPRTPIHTEIDYKHLLLNLLATVHRDEGHYSAKHGIEKATDDAIEIFQDMCDRND